MIEDQTMIKLAYSIDKYNFYETIKNWLDVNSLEKIHIHDDFLYNEKFERKNDQSTIYHKRYYERENPFFELYEDFIKDEIRPLYDEPIVYQKIPNIRLHFPGNVAVGEWHRDRNYRDPSWAAEVKELNYYLPFTKAFSTNTIWAESEEDKKDFSPMECEYGEYYKWDASNLLHGSKDNTTDITRVSVDFRVISKSNFKPLETVGSINTKTKFDIGGYYQECI